MEAPTPSSLEPSSDDDMPPAPPPEDSSPSSTEETLDPAPVAEPDDIMFRTTQNLGDGLVPTTDSVSTSTTSEPEFYELSTPSPTDSTAPSSGIGSGDISEAQPTISETPRSINHTFSSTITATNVIGDLMTVTPSGSLERSDESLRTITNGASGTLQSETPSQSSIVSNGLSGGEIAAAVVLPILIVSLLLLGLVFCIRRRRRLTSRDERGDATAMYQRRSSQGDDKVSVPQVPPSTMTVDASNMTRGYGNGVDISDVSTGTPDWTPQSSTLRPSQAAITADSPSYRFGNNANRPPLVSAGRGGSPYSTRSNAWHLNFASDPFNDSRAGTAYSSNQSATWSNFSGAGAGPNTAIGYTAPSSNQKNEPSMVSSIGERDRPSENDEAVSVVSSLSDAGEQDVEVGVAQRASVIPSKGISRPK